MRGIGSSRKKKEKASNCLKNFNERKIVTSNLLTAAFNFGFEIHLEKNKTDIKVFFHSKVQKSRNLFFYAATTKLTGLAIAALKALIQ